MAENFVRVVDSIKAPFLLAASLLAYRVIARVLAVISRRKAVDEQLRFASFLGSLIFDPFLSVSQRGGLDSRRKRRISTRIRNLRMSRRHLPAGSFVAWIVCVVERWIIVARITQRARGYLTSFPF